MGGLVIQSFILEELIGKRQKHLDRLTEVMLYGTPSGGLKKAGWGLNLFVEQVENMDVSGEFIQDLRSQWKIWVDDSRTRPDRLSRFKLTLVAGMKDRFVPEESSLRPFPLDEKELVPGDHISMIKPASTEDLAYRVLKARLLRKIPTAKEQRAIDGESPEVINRINRVRAAAELGDVDDLLGQAQEARAGATATMPRVDRELGLALLDHQRFAESAELLDRYLKFRDHTGSQPFRGDAQAVQQLAIALSGVGDIIAAVQWLKQLDPQIANDPETQGILAGRFKRQWLKKPDSVQLGWRAFQLYKAGFQAARSKNDPGQVVYNGINAAYLCFALGTKDYDSLAREVIAACESPADFWSDASRGEAYLLLREYPAALAAYLEAQCRAPVPRHWATTAHQALDILARQGNPPGGREVAALFRIDPRDPY